jgi:hypothetical protein
MLSTSALVHRLLLRQLQYNTIHTCSIPGPIDSILTGLFWFGWYADKGVHRAPTLLSAIPFAWGNIVRLCIYEVYLRVTNLNIYRPPQRYISQMSTDR